MLMLNASSRYSQEPQATVVCHHAIPIANEVLMGQAVVHWEFWSEDPAKIADFYEKVFAWNIRPIPELNYQLVETGGQGGINGGILKPQAGPWPAKLAFYIDVDDIDRYNERVRQAGGKVLVEKMDLPGVGQLSLFEDPDGRVLGLWKQLR
jgi:predicted enzyme related to lactoylglutathione lyase